MKLHDWAIIFFSIFLVNFLVIFISVKTTQAENINDTRYSDYLTTATEDAIASVSGNGSYIFCTERNRTKATNVFYETLAHCMEEEIRGKAYVQDMVPFIIMVDTDGYYVQYRDFDSEHTLATRVTPLNTWSSSVSNGQFTIRYFLNDYVEVLDRVTGDISKGHRNAVYEDIGSADLYFLSQNSFYEERDYVVVNKIEDSINYYCNQYNYSNPLGYTYEVTLPRTIGTDEGRLIDGPCIISFLQGEWFGLTGTEANIYAFSGSEITIPTIYGITYTDEILYHTSKCPLYQYITSTGTMEDCAKLGAYPCPSCVR